MLRLATFGGLSLVGDGEAVPAAMLQRRRLALLAVLAVAGQRGVRRDRVLGLLWPERPDDRARHVLSQAVYALRREGGASGIAVGGDELRLDPGAVTSDVADFETALARGDLEVAAALYDGPFLDGFHLPDAPEFERWAAAERERLARAFAGAVEALATAMARRGAHGAAAGHWRRLVAAAPLSASATVGLVEALVARGDRAEALRAVEVHAALVREELGADPAPVVAEWRARLRAPVAGAASMAAPSPTRDGAPTPASPDERAAATDAHAASASDDDGERARLELLVGARWAVGEPCARGSIATSYSARDRGTGEEVVLHVVDPRVATTGDVAAVLTLCERLAAFTTPLVEPLLDCGGAPRLLFFVTRPVAGESLRDRLARERMLPIGDAARIALDVARALAYAHARGVVHGDLRPKHVHLGAAHAQLGGFVGARALHGDGDRRSSVAVAVGAPAYLSPEAFTGEAPIDARGDVYALGCILAEMLTGEPPFGREASHAVVARKLSQPPPSLRALRPSVPETLERIVHTCVARVRADRYESAAALVAALEPLCAQGGRSGRT